MPNNIMTLQLNGEVSFEAFAQATRNFHRLVNALSSHFRSSDVDWFVDNLSIGSALTTIRGESPSIHRVEVVVNGFDSVAEALQSGMPIPYTRQIGNYAVNLRRLIDNNLTHIKLETTRRDYIIRNLAISEVRPFLPAAYGAVQGRVQTVSNRKTLRFTLYDLMYDKAVSCYLEEGYEHVMREAWGHEAIVEGLITRDPESGRPTTVRQVSNVEVVPQFDVSYTDARSILIPPHGAEPPEIIIRRMRDGQ